MLWLIAGLSIVLVLGLFVALSVVAFMGPTPTEGDSRASAMCMEFSKERRPAATKTAVSQK